MGLDVGERRIGVAISDPEGRLAVPVKVIERRGRTDTSDIAALAEREGAERIVVGLPLSLDGAAGRQAEQVQEFAEQLRAVTPIEVVFHDERFSSMEADHHLRAAGTNTRDARGRRDAIAASIILQAHLDSLRHPPLPPFE